MRPEARAAARQAAIKEGKEKKAEAETENEIGATEEVHRDEQ